MSTNHILQSAARKSNKKLGERRSLPCVAGGIAVEGKGVSMGSPSVGAKLEGFSAALVGARMLGASAGPTADSAPRGLCVPAMEA